MNKCYFCTGRRIVSEGSPVQGVGSRRFMKDEGVTEDRNSLGMGGLNSHYSMMECNHCIIIIMDSSLLIQAITAVR